MARSAYRSLLQAIMVMMAVFALGLSLVACSGNENKTEDKDSAGSAASSAASDSNFEPVTIKHALGTAEVKAKPERVVTLGQGSAETAIALGVIPVAVEKYDWGADESGYLPWVKEGVEAKGGELPALLKGQDQLSPEEILGYEPDLILAPWSGITQEQYDKLSEIAPTVAYPKDPWTIGWQEQIETVATALGQKDKAQELIDGIEKEFKDAQEPEYKDTTFSYIYNNGTPADLGIFMPEEQRVEFVTRLGLQIDPVYKEFENDVIAGTVSASLSPENLDKLKDSDIIFTFYASDDNRKEMHADPTYSRVPAIAKGAEVAAADQSFVTASSMINPLSVPWAIARYKELINKAIEASKK